MEGKGSKKDKILVLFDLLKSEYEARVVYYNGTKRVYRIYLKVDDQAKKYWIEKDDFRHLIITLAREKLEQSFSAADVNKLILQLESISTFEEED